MIFPRFVPPNGWVRSSLGVLVTSSSKSFNLPAMIQLTRQDHVRGSLSFGKSNSQEETKRFIIPSFLRATFVRQGIDMGSARWGMEQSHLWCKKSDPLDVWNATSDGNRQGPFGPFGMEYEYSDDGLRSIEPLFFISAGPSASKACPADWRLGYGLWMFL